jgi:hypothetical protein
MHRPLSVVALVLALTGLVFVFLDEDKLTYDDYHTWAFSAAANFKFMHFTVAACVLFLGYPFAVHIMNNSKDGRQSERQIPLLQGLVTLGVAFLVFYLVHLVATGLRTLFLHSFEHDHCGAITMGVWYHIWWITHASMLLMILLWIFEEDNFDEYPEKLKLLLDTITAPRANSGRFLLNLVFYLFVYFLWVYSTSEMYWNNRNINSPNADCGSMRTINGNDDTDPVSTIMTVDLKDKGGDDHDYLMWTVILCGPTSTLLAMALLVEIGERFSARAGGGARFHKFPLASSAIGKSSGGVALAYKA